MSDEYTPTTAEIRDYVEIGGEPRPWEPPTPEIDAARVAAFDRWLAGVIADAKLQGLQAARDTVADRIEVDDDHRSVPPVNYGLRTALIAIDMMMEEQK